MALVGSISGSAGRTDVTSSFVPSANTFNLGASANKWGTVYANYMTASISSSDGTNPFLKAGSNVTLNYNSLGQWEITASSGGGGGGAGVFTEASNVAAFTTSSIAIGFGGVGVGASSKGSEVFFAVSASNPSQNAALFSGPVITSGSLTLKDFTTPNVTVAYIDGFGNISGSSITTSGNAIFTGSLEVKSTISGSGNISTNGDLAVNGGDMTTTASTFNLLSSVSSKLNIGSSTPTVNVGSSTGIVVIPGDLFVSGTTVTVDVENITVEDPLIGLGFVTGNIASPAGDRGFIGGGPGSVNVAFLWSDNEKAFVTTKTTAPPGSTSVSIQALQPMRASSFQVSGSTAQIKSTGNDITVSGSQVDLVAGTTGINFFRDNSNIAAIDSGSYGSAGNAVRLISKNNALLLGAASGYDAYVSGSNAVYLDAGGLGVVFSKNNQQFAAIEQVSTNEAALTAKSPVSTAYVFNTQATALNIGGAATSVSIGSSTGLTRVNNSLIVTGSLTVTGSSYIGSDSSDVLQVFALVTGSLLPFGDRVTDLGSATNRWGNIYTGDLHLRNERGDYTLIEEEDFLSIRFNKNGKRYKFLLERVPELDEK